MKILWFTWKDRKHPLAGGAEVVNEALSERLVQNGHEVIKIVGGFGGAQKEEIVHGVKIIRVGTRWSVYLGAYWYYKKNLVGWADLVIDEVNTIPFFCQWYVKEKNIIFIHQLCREIWFYEMFFPLNRIGYALEPLYLKLLNRSNVITVSESTKKDLSRFGFDTKKISIISEGIEIFPLQSVEICKKFEKPTLLILGSIRSMKRTLHGLRAFELVKQRLPMVQLAVAGKAEGKYGEKVLRAIENSVYKDSIVYHGTVTQEQKKDLLQKSHILLVTSVKEGWGLVVTEANSQGTPAVVYDVDGLRDAVKHGETGIVCEASPEALAESVIGLLQDKGRYEILQKNAFFESKKVTFEKSYQDFFHSINQHV